MLSRFRALVKHFLDLAGLCVLETSQCSHPLSLSLMQCVRSRITMHRIVLLCSFPLHALIRKCSRVHLWVRLLGPFVVSSMAFNPKVEISYTLAVLQLYKKRQLLHVSSFLALFGLLEPHMRRAIIINHAKLFRRSLHRFISWQNFRQENIFCFRDALKISSLLCLPCKGDLFRKLAVHPFYGWRS